MVVRQGYSVYREARWPPLRLKAKRRDGLKCTNCGARGRLEVHHEIPVRQAPELAFELGNVTCLCPTCHTKETRRELGLEPNPERQAWRDLLRKGIANVGVCRSEEHTSELQSLMRISYAVYCLKKKKMNIHYFSTLY